MPTFSCAAPDLSWGVSRGTCALVARRQGVLRGCPGAFPAGAHNSAAAQGALDEGRARRAESQSNAGTESLRHTGWVCPPFLTNPVVMVNGGLTRPTVRFMW